jgi:hypothetical protein
MCQRKIFTSCILNHASSRKWKWLFLVMMLFLFESITFLGCSSVQLADFPRTPASSFGSATTKNDLCIAAHPIMEGSDLGKYFGSCLEVTGPYQLASGSDADILESLLKKLYLQTNQFAESGFIIEGDNHVSNVTSGCSDLYGVIHYKPNVSVHYADIVQVPDIKKCYGLKQYFGSDFAQLHVLKLLPVYIFIENRSSTTSFLFSKENISLQHNNGNGALKQIDKAINIVTGQLLQEFLDIYLWEHDISVLKKNCAEKELQTQTISPGKTVDGFLYFGLSDKDAPFSNSEWSISIDVKNTVNYSTDQFVLTLN